MKMKMTFNRSMMCALMMIVPGMVFAQGEGNSLPPLSTYSIDADDTHDSIRIKAAHVVPTANQYAALQDEFIAFVHFGPNTFTRMEWGSGMESPEVFALQDLDTDQWCKAMRDAGMTKVILTVKHHDGFVLWQSRYTEHGLMSSGFREGNGDVLADLSKSCQKYGLKLGVYLSPADLYQIEHPEGLYGNLSEKTSREIPRKVEGRPFENPKTFTFTVDDYNEYFLNQLFELLTEYGPIHEVWFDGAHPKTKGGQTYDYNSWKELIGSLAPEAVIFGRQDIRWGGNESGRTRAVEWNTIPYQEDPNRMNSFADITGEQVAAMENLYPAKFLHYQPAEINTSIREGWFYRNDDEQGVRSADDVFDIYERSVGGNTIFLLNIPPNREGLFPQRDVEVLREVGKRIKETYGTDLMERAEGPKEILDEDESSYLLQKIGAKPIEIRLAAPTKINRLVIQEEILQHGERVAAFTVKAEVGGSLKVIAKGKNIGYKNILRFPEITTSKISIEIDEARYEPVAISKVAVYYYHSRPPQLQINRSLKGLVSISPKPQDFGWKTYDQDIAGELNQDMEIYYSLDGSNPGPKSVVYQGPFTLENGEVKAIAINKGALGPVEVQEFGLIKEKWLIAQASSALADQPSSLAIDGDPSTYWKSAEGGEGQYIAIKLPQKVSISGFTYSPPVMDKEGMIEKGMIYSSQDGEKWTLIESFELGNLINDPEKRTIHFQKPVKTRYLKIEAIRIAGGHSHAAIAEIGLLVD
ncbi:hypothetical protein GCM10007049_16800 [Echinicola pacifica]|uniref:alpha-L-fucosidase n=1 Tax=Echinicola pacifica TaxID=346377 RepID=A0A918PW42_9BACT|nr:alpha-L-fucosidase [Echinicola pacifica]GGZ24988.1 hypothetical protein GCM10007049_16800 [Echinicola pacifica]